MRNNEVRLLGNVVAEPETFDGQNGSFARLRLASNTKRGESERTCYINVKLFGRAYSDLVYHEIEKGDRILVEGELVQEEYVVDEQKKTAYVIYANSALKIHRKPRVDSSGSDF